MALTVKLPSVSNLDCAGAGGDLSLGNLNEYFRGVSQLPGQIKSQLATAMDAAADDISNQKRTVVRTKGYISSADAANLTSALEKLAPEAVLDVLDKMTQVEDLIDQIQSFLSPRPFSLLNSKETEAKYRAREIHKNIEQFFKKKVVEILTEIISFLGIPTPLDIALPFAPGAKVGDMFTSSGNATIKAAIASNITSAASTLGLSHRFDGKLGVNVPEMTAEEVWQKAQDWLNKTLNDWIGSAINAIVGLLGDIPVIGTPIKAVLNGVDPTIAIETSIKASLNSIKSSVTSQITSAKALAESIADGNLSQAAKDDAQQQINSKITTAQNALDGGINTLLGVNIPFLGGVGSMIGISDISTELKKNKVHFGKEYLFHQLEDAFDYYIDKARRIFRGSLISQIHAIIDAAPSIIKNIPIVGTIFNCIDKIVKILSGQNPFTACDVITLIAPQVFNMNSLTTALIPTSITKQTSQFGFLPEIT
jgi:hypothetical protein